MEIELFLHIQPPLLDNILAHGPPALPLWNPITPLLAAILREFPRWNMQLYFTPLDQFYRWQLDRQQEYPKGIDVNARTRSLNLAPSVYSLLLCRLTQPAGQTFLLSFKEPINRNSTREAGTEWKEGIEAVRMVSLSLSQSINLLSIRIRHVTCWFHDMPFSISPPQPLFGCSLAFIYISLALPSFSRFFNLFLHASLSHTSNHYPATVYILHDVIVLSSHSPYNV